jgi:AraC family transcriptional regulator, glycine betaine-responsive activator
MMHALITQHHGSQFARQVSDWFLHTEIQGSADAQRAGLSERYHVYSPAVLAVIELMENHIGDPMDTAQLADVAGLSSRQLHRLFQSQLKSSPMVFYRILRLNKASNLLSQSAMPVSDIAIACGFFDNAHFTRCFKKQFGYAPKQVRIPD